MATLLLATVGLVACGGSGHDASLATTAVASHAPPPRAHPILLSDYDDDDYYHGYGDEDSDDNRAPRDRDGDSDERPNRGYYDRDDGAISRFGRPASAAERAAVVALAKRYYAAAARDDGAPICAMLAPALARAFVESVGEHGPHFTHGLRTCPQILAKVFAGATTPMLAFSLRPAIASVRVSHNMALVVLGAKPFPLRVFSAVREGGKWYAYGAFDSEVP